jgi:hypothetical protein
MRKRAKVASRLLRGLAGISSATLLLLLLSQPALASTQTLRAQLSGAQEVPADTSTATGSCTASVDTASGHLTFSGTFSGLRAAATAAAIHGLVGSGAIAGVIVPQTTVTNAVSGTFSGSGTLTSQELAGTLAGQTYCEIDDAAFPSGEIRGQLTVSVAAPAFPPLAVGLLVIVLGGVGLVSLRGRTRDLPA